jgi:hypothetical protein
MTAKGLTVLSKGATPSLLYFRDNINSLEMEKLMDGFKSEVRKSFSQMFPKQLLFLRLS